MRFIGIFLLTLSFSHTAFCQERAQRARQAAETSIMSFSSAGTATPPGQGTEVMGGALQTVVELTAAAKILKATGDVTVEVGGKTMHVVKRGSGYYLLFDGVSKGLLVASGKDPTLFPLATYAGEQFGIFDPDYISKAKPSVFQCINCGVSPFGGAVTKNAAASAIEAIASAIGIMLTVEMKDGKELFSPTTKKFVRFGSLAAAADFALRFSGTVSENQSPTAFPLLDYTAQTISRDYLNWTSVLFDRGNKKSLGGNSPQEPHTDPATERNGG